MWRNCSKLGRGPGTTAAVCNVWRRRGEDGLCDAGGAPGTARRPAAGAARAGQGHGHGAADQLRSRERHNDGAVAVHPQHVHRRRRPRKLPAPGDRPGRVGPRLGAPGRLHRRRRDDPGRRLHRRRPRPPRARPPVHRGQERQHRRHAGRALLPPPRGRARAGARGDLHAQPGHARLPGRPPHRRRPRPPRHPRLSLRLLRRVEEGRPADVEQARVRARRPRAARRLQGDPDARAAIASG